MANRMHTDVGKFVTIGDGIYLRMPEASDSNQLAEGGQHEGTNPPSVILIFGWMAAKLSHLHKYTQVYSKLYPQATQILVRSTPTFFWSSEAAQESRLEPVVTALLSMGCVDRINVPDSRPRILIHAFSVGGSYQLVAFGRLLKNQKIIASPHTICGMVFDSTPSGGSLATTKKAFTAAISNPILIFLMGLLVTILHLQAKIRTWLFGHVHLAEALKGHLLNPRLVPWTKKSTPRLYIYSKTDELVSWKEVRGHVEAAEAAGLNVKSEEFHGTSHVQHVRADPVRYWSIVRALWAGACTVQ